MTSFWETGWLRAAKERLTGKTAGRDADASEGAQPDVRRLDAAPQAEPEQDIAGDAPVLRPPPEGWSTRNETLSYHTYAREQIAALRLAEIEAGQDLRARIVRMERRSAEMPLRVLFLLPHIALFDAYAPLYAAMEDDPLFEPEILAFKRRDVPHDVTEAETRAFLEGRGLRAHLVGFDGSDEWPQLDPDAYDLLFYTLGSLAYPEPYRIERTSHHFLTCYLAYGVLLADQPELQFNQDSHHCAWRVFASTRRDLFFYRHYQRRLRSNARLTGYPKFDLYDSGVLVETGGGRPSVVWAPHWTIGLIYPELNMGMFDRICMDMLSVMDEFPNVDFVYRPHPNLPHALAATTFMSAESYAIYLDMLRARPNCRIETGGDNIALFRDSAGMITDSVSFLAEHLPSGRPLLFLDRPDRARLNDQGERIAALHIQGRDGADIRAFIAQTVVGGADPRAVERRSAAADLFYPNRDGATAAILGDLRAALVEPVSPAARRDLAATQVELQQRRIEKTERAQELSDSYWLRQSAYNYAQNFPERHRNQIRFIDQHLLPRLDPKAVVLDIGCADGWSSCAVAKACGELHGYDLNPAFIDLARRNAEAAGLVNCRFTVGDALVLQPEADAYDAAMLGGLLTCIVEDQEALQILRVVARSLRPGGLLLLKDTLHRGAGSRLNIQGQYGAVYRDLATYENLARDAGFDIVVSEWIDKQDDHGSFMAVASKNAAG